MKNHKNKILHHQKNLFLFPQFLHISLRVDLTMKVRSAEKTNEYMVLL